MSIASATYAEWANEQKDVWVQMLGQAIKEKNWTLAEVLLKQMQQFYFTE
jgi:hypothetical protein